MNITILTQVLKDQTENPDAVDKEVIALADKLKGTLALQGMTKGSITALMEHPDNPTVAIMAILTYALHVGMAYAKAEREVAELEEIT